MNKESDILKWFEGEISTETIKQRYPDEDFEAFEKLGFYATHIKIPQINAQEALAEFKTRTFKKEEPKVIPLNFKSFIRVAAILVVLLSSSYFLFFNNNKTYSTQIAKTQTFNLPDNSQVVLNAQSKIIYNKKTWKDNRDLELDGEAFFKVSKGQKFTVVTDAGIVQVLGTEFNVKERPNYFEVKCYEGSVSVTHQSNKSILTRGKIFRVINGEIVPVKDFEDQEPSWIADESSFNNVPLWQVINELELQYDITIISNNIDDSKMFTGSFTHNDRNIALQSVTIPLKLSYKINGNKVEFYNYEKN